MENKKALILLGMGTAGALLLLARKAVAKPPENIIEVVSCLAPEKVSVGEDVVTGAILSAPSTNIVQVTKIMEAKLSNCVKTKEVTMNPGETRTETITFAYADCPLDMGTYYADIKIL